MNVDKIKSLDTVLSLSEDETIVEEKIQRLTAAGDNYGSLMLSVDITVQTPRGEEEINAVAKLIPPNAFIQKVFNTQETFKNEIAFYNRIVPTLHDFQREQGMENLVDFFPKCYGGRINLTGDPDLVDSDAVILLQNLKKAGFKNFERTVGFDLDTAKLIVTDLAYLHAVPLALKIHKPEVFEREVKKYLKPLPFAESEDFNKKIAFIIDKIDEIKIYKARIMKAISLFYEKKEVREPFGTIAHNDCWVNNAMVRVEKGKSLETKLVDFQICEYGSPAKDLIFFLFTSVQNNIIERNYEDLVKLYHNTFVLILKQLNCDTTGLSYQHFLKEVDTVARNTEFMHVTLMTFPIFAEKGTVKEIQEIQPEDFLSEQPEISDVQKEKLIFIVKQFAKRNWI